MACSKCAGGGDLQDVVAAALELVQGAADPIILGPGGTMWAIKEALLGPGQGSPSGVDVILPTGAVDRDVTRAQLEERVGDGRPWVIVSPIAGQGALLGRGNQVIGSEMVTRCGWDRVIPVATADKLATMDSVFVDLAGLEAPSHVRVLIGPGRWRLVRVAKAP